MRKTGWAIFLILSLSLIGFIYWQWNEFKGNSISNNQDEVEQQIDIKQKSDRLIISHTFFHVNGDEISVIYPELISEIKCGNEGNIECREVINVDNKNVHFHYEIRFDSAHSSHILQDWFVKLNNIRVNETIINITVDKEIAGYWATNAPLTFYDEMENVRYFSFVSEQAEYLPLIWHKEPLQYTKVNEKILLYYEGEINTETLSFLEVFTKLENKKYPTLIISNEFSPQSLSGLVITSSNDEPNQIEMDWITRFLMENYSDGKEEERWLFDLLAAYIANYTPANELQLYINELEKNVSEEEKQQWITLILQDNRYGKIDAKILDYYLGQIKNMNTSFFERCRQTQLGSYVEMYFTMNKPIILQGNHELDESVIIKNQHMYLPFETIVKEFGFDFKKISDTEYYITDGVDVYRFYKNRDIFIFNEEMYGFFANEKIDPIIIIDEKIYASEKVFSDIFKFELYNLEEQIQIY